MAETLVVAGLCARPLAESAVQAGWRVIALDLYGDADTRRASARWLRIGDPAAFAIDPPLLREALQEAAREPGAIGWVAGSGFEADPGLLDAGPPGLPLLGMDANGFRRVRDPHIFFGTLDRVGVAHPEVSFRAPRASDGWLVKQPGGFGGWHIRPARAGDNSAAGSRYWQRRQQGEPMSALFLADGLRPCIVALNRLLVRPLGTSPFVYHGALGPVRDAGLAQQMQEALGLLVPALGLRGLASLDFLAHEGRAWLLEVNPRPSATMVLHEGAWPGGLLRAHVRALEGTLPATPASHRPGVRGDLVVYADRDCRAGPGVAAQLAASPDCHDLPAGGAAFGRHQPVCSITAAGNEAGELLGRLDARAQEIRRCLAPAQEAA